MFNLRRNIHFLQDANAIQLSRPAVQKNAPASEGGRYKRRGSLVVTGAVEDLDGVREEFGEGVERFDGAFGAAR